MVNGGNGTLQNDKFTIIFDEYARGHYSKVTFYKENYNSIF